MFVIEPLLAGLDYERVNMTLTFAPLPSPEVMCVSVSLIPDEIAEDTEMFTIVASSLTESVTLTPEEVPVSILDNDSK